MKRWLKDNGLKVEREKAIFLLSLILLVLTGVFLLSCATPNQRKAVKHFKKFEKFGGSVDIDTVEVEVPIMVRGKDGMDSLVYVSVKADCPKAEFPKSSTQVRQEGKTKRTITRQEERTERKVDSNDVKEKKSDNRAAKKELDCWTWWDKLKFALLMFAVGFMSDIIVKFVFGIIKKVK